MTKHYNFYWLDDSKSKVDDMRSVVEAGISELELTSTVSFAEITPNVMNDLASVAEKIKSSATNLIIVDHVINQKGPLNTKGSSVAHLLRSACPDLPIVCVSAAWGEVKSDSAFDQEDLSEYTHIFPYSQLAEDSVLELLYAIAGDFGRCVAAAENGNSASIAESLLDAPKTQVSSLNKILPAEFKEPEQKTTPHRMARWILGTFMSRPGYLYNEIRAASLLGLNVAGFAKVKHRFEESLYSGVFATKSTQKWWVAGLHNQLASMLAADAPGLTELAGRTLEGITEHDYSKCHIADTVNPFPDAVAYLDDKSKQEVAVRVEFTKIYPADVAGRPGFEPRLVVTKR